MILRVVPRTTLLTLLSIVAVLTLGNVVGAVFRYYLEHGFVYGLVPLFDMNEEANLPTFYSTLVLMCAAGLLFITARASLERDDSQSRHWLGLSVIFVFLAVDEAASVHELLAVPLQAAWNTSGYLFYAWVIPYGALVVIFAAFYLRFWLRLPVRTRWLFAMSGVFFVLGAVGMEMLAGNLIYELGGFEPSVWQARQEHPYYVVMYSIEELLEMIGIALFIYSIVDYLATTRFDDPVKIVFSN